MQNMIYCYFLFGIWAEISPGPFLWVSRHLFCSSRPVGGLWAGSQSVSNRQGLGVCLWVGCRWTNRFVSPSICHYLCLFSFSPSFCSTPLWNPPLGIFQKMYPDNTLWLTAHTCTYIRPCDPSLRINLPAMYFKVWATTPRPPVQYPSEEIWLGSKFSRWPHMETVVWPCPQTGRFLVGETRSTCSWPPSLRPHR